VCRLRTAELLLLAAGRLWVAHYLDPTGARPRWDDGFDAAGLDGVVGDAFASLFGAFAAVATRKLEFHGPTCPCLGEDEAALLRLFGLLQRNREREAGRILTAWLAPAAVRIVLAPASMVAQAMADAGLDLPLRGPDSGRQSGDFLLSDHGLELVH
jgi:hypothetical protein